MRARSDSGSNQKELQTVINSVASSSGVGHLVGIAEHNDRKPMKEQIVDLRRLIAESGQSHLIDTSKCHGMQSELKMLNSILNGMKANETMVEGDENDEASENFNESSEFSQSSPEITLIPRRGSFAQQLVSKAQTIGIHTSDETPTPLLRKQPNSKRRLSTVIKSVASNSGVGHLVGIAEQNNRKPMKEQLGDLRQEIIDLGLSHLVDENHKTMSMNAEIKALKKIISDYKIMNGIRAESLAEEPESILEEETVAPLPRRSSFVKQLETTAQSIGIRPALTTGQPSISLSKSQSKRRLSTVIKSVASNSGVGHLVGIAEQNNRKPMKEQLGDLRQEIIDLGLSHLVDENHKTMSMNAEIKALKKILDEHRNILNSESEDSLSELPQTSVVSRTPFSKSLFLPFPSFDESSSDYNEELLKEKEESLENAHQEIEQLNLTVNEMSEVIEMQYEEILLTQTQIKEKDDALELQQANILDKQKICEELAAHLQQSRLDLIEMTQKIESLERLSATDSVTHKIAQNQLVKYESEVKVLQSQLEQEKRENVLKSSQIEQISSNATTLIAEMQRELIEKDRRDIMISNLSTEKEELVKNLALHSATVATLNTRIEGLEKELLQSQSTISDFDKQINVLEDEKKKLMESLTTSLAKKQGNDNNLLVEVQMHLREKDLKDQEILKLQLELNESRISLEMVSSELKDREERLKFLESQLDEATEGKLSLLKEQSSTISSLAFLTSQHELTQKELSSAQAMISRLEKRASTLEEEKKYFQDRLNSSLANNAEESSSSALLQELKNLIKEKEEKDRVIVQLRIDAAGHHASLSQKNTEISDLVESLKKVESQRDRILAENEEVIKKLAVHSATVATLNTRIEGLEKELLQSQSTISDFDKQINVLEDEKKKLMESLTTSFSKNSEVAATSSALVTELQMHLREKDLKDQEILKLQLELNESRISLEMVSSELKDREERLKFLESQLGEARSQIEIDKHELTSNISLVSSHQSEILRIQEAYHTLERESFESNRLLIAKISALELNAAQFTSTIESLEKQGIEYVKKEAKLVSDVNDLNDLIAEQNRFLSDAAESFDVAEEEIEEFERELITAHAEIKRLKLELDSYQDERNAFQIKLGSFEENILSLQKENSSLQEYIREKIDIQENHSILTLVSDPNANSKAKLLTTLYSGYSKNSIPLSAYTQLQIDNQKLLKKVVEQNREINDLGEIMAITFKNKEKVLKQFQDTEVSQSPTESTWLEMNQIPVFKGYDLYCKSYMNNSGGNIFDKIYSSNPKKKQSLHDFSVEIQSPIVPLSPQDAYLKDSIRRLRIGWIVVTLGKHDDREVIVHFDLHQKLLQFVPLRMEKDFHSSRDLDVYLSMITLFKKNDSGEIPCIEITTKSNEITILKFVASGERDLFFDSFLCIIIHIDPTTRIFDLISLNDVETSRYLKANFVKNANGDYVLISFNRRSTLRHQSSIATLQSAGLFTNSESNMFDFLESEKPVKSPSSLKSQTSLLQPILESFPVSEQNISPSITSSQSSQLSMITSDLTPIASVMKNEGKKPLKMMKTQQQSKELQIERDLDDMGLIYKTADDRPQKKSFFQSSQAPSNRHTFSHENPISFDRHPNNSNNGSKPILTSKSHSAGADDPPKNFFQALPQVSSRKSESSTPKATKEPLQPPNTVSVGAENASRFLKRRKSAILAESRKNSTDSSQGEFQGNAQAESSVGGESKSIGRSTLQSLWEDESYSNFEDDISVLSGDSSLTAGDSFVSRSSFTPERGSLRRRGSASSVLAQQTAQFRKKLAERPPETE